MKEATFECDILYSQIAVFNYGLDNPYNDWNDIHVQQGFCWREGSVSFGTISNDVECRITVKLAEKIELDKDISRAIVVPYEVKDQGIEIGSIMETVAFDIPRGRYELLFTAKRIDIELEQYTVMFVKANKPRARILVADEDLSVSEELLMDARAAI